MFFRRAFIPAASWFCLVLLQNTAQSSTSREFPRFTCADAFARVLGRARSLDGRSLPETTNEAIGVIRDLAFSLIDPENPGAEPTVCHRFGYCNLYSGRLQEFLDAQGVKLERYRVDHQFSATLQDDYVVHQETYHWYLVLPATVTRHEIVVDPTYLQYFPGKSPLDEPPVFVGDRDDLIAFFQKHQDRLRLPAPPISMADFVDSTYAMGFAKHFRKR